MGAACSWDCVWPGRPDALLARGGRRLQGKGTSEPANQSKLTDEQRERARSILERDNKRARQGAPLQGAKARPFAGFTLLGGDMTRRIVLWLFACLALL